MYNFSPFAFDRISNWNFLTLCSFTDFFTKILLIIWLLMRVIAVDLVLHSFARHDLLIGARACVLHLIANLRAPNRQRRTKRWFLLLHVVVVVVLPTPLAWNGFRMIFLRIRQMWFYIVPSFLISKISFQKKYSHNLSVKSRNETTNSPIHQVTNLKCSIKAREPFKTPF